MSTTSAGTTRKLPAPPSPWEHPKALVATVVGVLVLAVCITWSFWSMRAVMEVGGSCSSGGPYVSAQPCPDGAVLISVAIPVMMLTAMIGTGTASVVGAPNLLLPMWGLMFGALGWNFFEYGLSGDDVVIGWLVCGVMFWLMAAPAVWGMLLSVAHAVVPPKKPGPFHVVRWWIPAYVVLMCVGFLFGSWSWQALA